MFSQETFQDVLSEFICKECGFSQYSFHKKYNFPVANIDNWLKNGKVPSIKNIQKLLDSQIDDTYKTRLVSAALTQIYFSEEKRFIANEPLKINADEVNELTLSADKKDFWAQKFQKLILPKNFENRKSFQSILLGYTRHDESPSFAGFIGRLYHEWKFNSIESFEKVMNLARGGSKKWFNAIKEGHPESVTPDKSSIDKLIQCKHTDLDDYGESVLWKLARGNIKSPINLTELQSIHSIKLSECKTNQERNQTSNKLYQKMLDITGYTDLHISKKTKIPISNLDNYRNGKCFLEAAEISNPELAFNLASVVPGEITLQRDYAASFMGLECYKGKVQITDEFLKGDIKLNDVFLYTRLLITRSPRVHFYGLIKMKHLDRRQYPKFERGQEIEINPKYALDLAVNILKITNEEKLASFMEKVDEYNSKCSKQKNEKPLIEIVNDKSSWLTISP